ncbi:MAG: polymorphic toxin-type HINT domain-containing protein [Flectobacillus sp.]|uniref:polymorphic toxin-type HINT domain-containing protein n=1 Tax=Flectobacillus sp. TaxID=50419 RepID=UPI003B9DB4EE
MASKKLYKTECDESTLDETNAASIAYTVLVRFSARCLENLSTTKKIAYLEVLKPSLATGSGEYDINKATLKLLSSTKSLLETEAMLVYLKKDGLLYTYIDKFSGDDLYGLATLINNWLWTNGDFLPYVGSTGLTKSFINGNNTVINIATGIFGDNLKGSIVNNQLYIEAIGKDYSSPVLGSISGGGINYASKTIYKGNLNATDILYVYFDKDFSIGAYSFKKGNTYPLTGTMLYAIFNKNKWDNAKTTIAITIDIAGMAIGVGEIAVAVEALEAGYNLYRGYRLLKGMADLGVGLTDVLLNQALAEKLDPETLATWNRFAKLYMLGSLGAEGLEALAKWKLARIQANKSLEVTTKEEVDEVLRACMGSVCFVAGTKVASDTSGVSIERLQKGDKVWSWDLAKGKKVLQRVTNTFTKTAKKLVKLVIGQDTLYSTPEHPYYLPTEKAFRSAQSLRKGMQVLLLSGTLATVESHTQLDTLTQVYNIEVAHTHNYYVGNTQILVHNDCNTFLSKLTQKGYKKLSNAFTALDDATRAKFLADFENVGDDVLKVLNDDASLVDIWKNNLSKTQRTNISWLTKSKKVEVLVSQQIDINTLTKAPDGYVFFTRGNKRLIKRVDASEGLPQLTTEDDIIVKYTGEVRENNQALFIRNLEAKFGAMPLNHQRHHLVPVNVVADSPIHQEAIRRGLYTVDRTENGIYMAQTAEDWDLYGRGISDDLPFHYGSHPQWDDNVRSINTEYVRILELKYSNLLTVSDGIILQTLKDIEQKLIIELKKIGTSKLK